MTGRSATIALLNSAPVNYSVGDHLFDTLTWYMISVSVVDDALDLCLLLKEKSKHFYNFVCYIIPSCTVVWL